MATVDTAAALRSCRELTKRDARNFYYGLKLSPEPKRSALYAVYAWMRRADDLVDGSGTAVDVDEARAGLDRLQAETDQTLAGNPPEDADVVLIALAEVARTFALEAAPFHAMIAGQRADLVRTSYETFDELRTYCEQVASSVGQICIKVWGYRDKRAPGLAAERGVALQLTNILRDVVEDARRGRHYLPAEDLARHGLTSETLLNWRDPMRCSRFVVEQVDRAEAYYARSQPLGELIEPDARPTLWAMTEIYHRLLEQIRAAPERVVKGGRIRITPWAKSAIALGARWRSRAGAS